MSSHGAAKEKYCSQRFELRCSGTAGDCNKGAPTYELGELDGFSTDIRASDNNDDILS